MTRSQCSSSRGLLGCAATSVSSKASISARNSDIQNSFSGAGKVSAPMFGIMVSDTLSLHPVVGASDGRGHPGRDEAETATGWDVTDLRAPAATAAREPVGPRAAHLLRAGWRWLVRLNDRIEDCWIGDLLGGVLLFLAGIGAFIAAGVLQ